MSVIKALFFDQDGTIIDTEKDGHRVAFNKAFEEFGYSFQWGVEKYHGLLKVAGGKERMRHYFKEESIHGDMPEEELNERIAGMHKRKTEIFISMIQDGKLPLRTGILRLMQEAVASEIKIGICTTSNERSATAIVSGILKEIPIDFVLAGDIVKRKKPDPEIYLLALRKTGLKPDECIVLEDSRNGVAAAKGAGIRCLATTNRYTENEDLKDADIVVTSLGDPNGEKGILKQSRRPFQFEGVVTLHGLCRFLSAT